MTVINATLMWLRTRTVEQTLTVANGAQIVRVDPRYSFAEILTLGVVLYTMGSGIGVAALGKASQSDKSRLLAITGALGFGAVYCVAAIVGRVFSLFFLPMWGLEGIDVVTTVRFAATGAVMGTLLGLVQKDPWQAAKFW